MTVCELILIAASSYTKSISEAFYVQLLTCPLGFTLVSYVAIELTENLNYMTHNVCNCKPLTSYMHLTLL